MGARVIHFEVVGKDGPGLQSFYSRVFGWDLDTNNPGGYGMLRPADGEGIGGGIGATRDGGPGHVTFYVHADDPAATLREVEAAGGRVLMPLTEVAPETTIALFADPEGHVVGLM
jgi:predicted enzyme related to lactoylglutathione lyase